MKQIQIENGVIRYYGNQVGRVTEGCAVVDPMFQNEALESFLRKQRNIQKIQWQDGIYDRLANSQEDMESAKGLKDVRIWQLRGDVDVHIPIPDAVAIFNLIDQLAGGNRFWSEETALQVEDAIAELQEIIRSLEESPECE